VSNWNELPALRRRLERSIAERERRDEWWREIDALTAAVRQAVLDGSEPVMRRVDVDRVVELRRRIEASLDGGKFTNWPYGSFSVFGKSVRIVE
jgi:hypothetical protein